eukprot:TRINITY_DN4036_c0_g1_i1.p1 TRINITY_DN4036_c0_g1~~TRINITY_DN4036_c0_g1_i1.p1  ORF type:complete len:186 (+),score=30.06 TRINITY_DN4036_c0_g1_i1:64-621(+)
MKILAVAVLLAIVGLSISDQLYITPTEPMEVTLTKSGYLASVSINPPFRMYYWAQASPASVKLDAMLLSGDDYSKFLRAETDIKPFPDLSATGQNLVEFKRVNFINAKKEDPYYLVIALSSETPAGITSANVTYYFDYIPVFVGLELWSFALVSAILGAIGIVIFIVFLYFMVTLFINPCCSRYN